MSNNQQQQHAYQTTTCILCLSASNTLPCLSILNVYIYQEAENTHIKFSSSNHVRLYIYVNQHLFGDEHTPAHCSYLDCGRLRIKRLDFVYNVRCLHSNAIRVVARYCKKTISHAELSVIRVYGPIIQLAGVCCTPHSHLSLYLII